VRISNIERGEGTRGPTFDVLHKIAAACDFEIQFNPRSKSKDSPLTEHLRRIAETIGGTTAVAVAPGPTFTAACANFVKSMQIGAPPPHFHYVEEPSAATSLRAPAEAANLTYIEMAARGQRMVMLPVLVEDTRKRGTDTIEMKLFYPNP
jgi:hypothetical protein